MSYSLHRFEQYVLDAMALGCFPWMLSRRVALWGWEVGDEVGLGSWDEVGLEENIACVNN